MEDQSDRIEKYLFHLLSKEEESAFEQELKSSSELHKETKEMSYFLYAIHQIGIKNDNLRLERIRMSAGHATRKYWMSIAAMFIVILTISAVTAIPAYKYVIKPVIEKVRTYKKLTNTVKESTLPMDTLKGSIDTLIIDTVAEPVLEPLPKPKQKDPVVTPAIKKDTVVTPVMKKDTIVASTSQPVIAQSIQQPAIKNKIASTSKLENYEFSSVSVTRKGNQVVCSFTMTNTEEDAKIEMHSARAQDVNGKNYPAKLCLLNGSSKRVKETWMRDEVHTIEISISEVPEDVTGFNFISFSFQSEGLKNKQKSQSIILKVEEL